MKKIFFDVTLLRNCPKRPTGILRVCAEFCRWFLENTPPSQIEFCFYEKTLNQFYTMSPPQVKTILNTLCNASPPPLPKFLRKLSILTKKAKLILSNKKAHFKDCSVYLDIGLNVRKSFRDKLLQKKQRYHFKLATFCHDLIPALEPQFSWTDNQRALDNVTNYFKFLGTQSNHIFCVSHYTQKDLTLFLNKNHIPTPPTSIFINGSNLTQNSTQTLTHFHNLISNNFILYVSSIDKRKNHDVIYKAYRLLREQGRTDLPKVVFVGAHFDGAHQLLNSITWDPKVKDLMISLNNVSDLELDWLYANCLFTLYPSLYEGWGIPVAESLEHGKFCLASNATSIPEVGGDFVDYIHPLDTFSWAQKISDYVDNPQMLNKKVQHIKKNYRPQSWDTSIQKAYQTLLAL